MREYIALICVVSVLVVVTGGYVASFVGELLEPLGVIMSKN